MMPADNAETYIGQVIVSVLVQSYSGMELVIVDDGSTERAAKVVSRYTDTRNKLLHEGNGGEASVRNTVFKKYAW